MLNFIISLFKPSFPGVCSTTAEPP